MTTAFILAATIVLVVGLFVVIVERTNERDEARGMVAALEAECNEHAAVSASLAQQLAESQGKVIPFPARTDSWLEAVIDEQMLRPDGAS